VSAARRFVLCPKCGGKSRKLCSEMGGLETRQCSSKSCGCVFEWDRWIGVRGGWDAAYGGRS
jgi:hypothetical protein